MSDTIELLEAIGQNAALRYASAEELTGILEKTGATDALKAAAASGDGSRLSKEFGHTPMQVPQSTQIPGHEDDEPDQDSDEGSRQSPTSEHGKPSHRR